MTFYAPLDLSWATRRATARIRPTVLALVELELWPNLVHSAKATGAAVLIVNGRLSERSYRGYRHLKGPLAATFRRLDLVAAQTSEYALRFENLGVPGDRVRVTGSVKYDNLVSDRHNPATEALREDLGIGEDEVVFVAGSTMEGEEAAAFQAYRVAAERHPRLRLIVVPRHAERFDRVAQWFESRCEPVVRRSVPDRSVGQGSLKQRPVIVIDTLGELGAVWGLADIAFVGGSLYPGRGGQNMLEPAAFGASVLFGPHTSNFRQAVEELLGRGAARRVRDARELTEALLADLENPASALARGEAARSFLSEQNGAAARTVHEIDRLLENILVSGVA